ncbi:YciI family protein [Aliikangiella sp. G2MR2-5]|uniref:YciI family protein n=1 Tax=Aliikangiella sp. G2MR2-5 TaxID=2788943 RepID=UPI0018A8B4F9|nr:YciI family protein [Aliikangiella sp. G2MR2-5]
MFLVDMIFTDVEKITPELTTQHKSYLEEEYKSNKLMFGGRKVPRTGGILISMHSSEQELVQVLKSDPFIKSGVASYSITEFVPVMASKDYSNIVA